MSVIRSTSKPTGFPFSMDSNGGNAVSDPTVRTPFFSVVNALPVGFATGVVPCGFTHLAIVVSPGVGWAPGVTSDDVLAHAAARSAIHATSSSVLRDLIGRRPPRGDFGSVLLLVVPGLCPPEVVTIHRDRT